MRCRSKRRKNPKKNPYKAPKEDDVHQPKVTAKKKMLRRK
jgi:hypothetical protein